MFDLDRVEVYRGPAGHAVRPQHHGRHRHASTSKRPTDTFEARRLDHALRQPTAPSRFDGAVGGPIAPGISGARSRCCYQHRDDWVDNTFPGERRRLRRLRRHRRPRPAAVRRRPTTSSILVNVPRPRPRRHRAPVPRQHPRARQQRASTRNYDRDTRLLQRAAAAIRRSMRAGAPSLQRRLGFRRTRRSPRSPRIRERDGSQPRRHRRRRRRCSPSGPGFIPFPSDTQDAHRRSRAVHAGIPPRQRQRPAASPGRSAPTIFDSGFDRRPRSARSASRRPTTRHSTRTPPGRVFGQVSYDVHRRVHRHRRPALHRRRQGLLTRRRQRRAERPRASSDDHDSAGTSAGNVRRDDPTSSSMAASPTASADRPSRAATSPSATPPSVATVGERSCPTRSASSPSSLGRRAPPQRRGLLLHASTTSSSPPSAAAANFVQLLNADKARPGASSSTREFRASSTISCFTGGVSLHRHRDRRCRPGRRHLRRSAP